MLSTLSRWICTTDKLFSWLAEGKDCRASNAELASAWFDANWPADLDWPDDIPRRPRRYRLPPPIPKQVEIRGVTYTATY